MAEPMILELLGNLKTRVATNETNIASNTAAINTNKGLFDTHAANDTRHWTTQDRQNFDRVVHFKGYYTTADKLKEAYPTGQVGDYAIIGATDTVWAWDDESKKWLNTTEQGVVISVNGRTGEVILTKTDVGLSNVDNTSDVNKPVSTAQQTALDKKADRGLITAAQADGNTLRSGIYYLNEDYTVLGDTTMYWSIIHSESLKKDGTGKNTSIASQIWINFQTNGSGKIYYRRQQYNYDLGKNDWSEFKEIMTNTQFDDLHNQIITNQSNIQVNTEEILKLQTGKADKQNITLSTAEDLTLKAGIYNINNGEKSIGSFSATRWTVIVGEQTGETVNSATQIWIPYSMDGEIAPKMFMRKQISQSSWSDFVELLTSEHLDALNETIESMQTDISDNTDNIEINTEDIATNAENIATNTANIASNRTDIDSLSTNKANRLPVANKNLLDGFSLRAGTYELSTTEGYTILGESSKHWNVIIGEFQSQSSATQIWMPYEYKTDAIPKMFIRRAKNGASWSDFVEVITSNIITRDEIARAKQYKGFYTTLIALRTVFPTATDGDYAIVGNAIYVWDNGNNDWSEISGGGTGNGKWSIKQYNAPASLNIDIPYIKDVINLSLDKQWEVNDSETILDTRDVDYKMFLIETWVNMNTALDWEQTFSHDDGVTIYLNGKIIKRYSGALDNDSFTASFKQGWNKLQILIREVEGREKLTFSSKITAEEQCLGINCYHSENELIEGYVPLVGDSTIEGDISITGELSVTKDINSQKNITAEGDIQATGNIQAGGIVGITSNAYLQYNENDKSISFIFN